MSKKDEAFRRYEKLAKAAKREKPGSASEHKPGSCAHCLYLAPEEQEIFMQAMDEVQASPSLSQAQRLKKLAQEGDFTMDAAREIMNEVKKGDLERVTFRNEQLRKYFPRSYTIQQMQDTIIKLLDQWQKKKARDQER